MSLIDVIDGLTQSVSRMRNKRPASRVGKKQPVPKADPKTPGKSRGRVKGFDTVDRDQLAKFLALESCKRAGKGKCPDALNAIKEAADHLIDGHGAFDGPRAEISIVDQMSSDIDAIRDAPKGYETWVNAAIIILAKIAEHIPADIGDDQIGLTAEAIGLIDQPRELFGEIVLMMMAKQGPVADAMKPMVRAIQTNIKSVPGVKLGRLAKDVFPSERRSKASTFDLAHDAFRDTPLLRMLTVHLPVSISMRLRMEHMNFVGPSGSGKTQFLQMMLSHDLPKIRQGKMSAVVFDTDGQLSSKIMAHVASDQALAERTVYIDLSKPDLRPNVNLFKMSREMVGYVIESLGEKFTDRQSIFFNKVATAITQIPNPNLDTLIKFLGREDFAQRYMSQYSPNVAEFVSDRLFGGQYTSTREQVLDRISSLRDIDTIGGMFDADETDLDMASILDDGHLLIIRIDKSSEDEGGLGQYAKLGCRFYLATIVMAIRSRNAMNDNTPTILYLDEIADLIGGGNDKFLVEFLIQARKKDAGVVLAYQYVSQLAGAVKAAALGNTAVKIAGKVEKSDRDVLSGNMDCSPELFRMVSKTKTHGQLAVSVSGMIDSAVLCRFPFLVLEGKSKGSARDMDDLMDRQRARWSRPRPVRAEQPVRKASGDNVIEWSPFR